MEVENNVFQSGLEAASTNGEIESIRAENREKLRVRLECFDRESTGKTESAVTMVSTGCKE